MRTSRPPLVQTFSIRGDEPKYHYLYALALSRRNELKTLAEDEFRMATMQDPENVEYRIEFANYLKENGKIILALRECEQARLIAPHNPKVEQLLHSLKKVAL